MVPQADRPARLSALATPIAGHDAEAAEAEPARRRRRWPWIAAAVLVAALVLVRLSVAETFKIPTSSMTPTLQPGDSVLVDKLAYKGDAAPKRGQMIVFHEPRTDDVVLKRVVAVGGQRVGIEDGRLVVDGRTPPEPYVDDPDAIDSVYFGPVRVPAGAVFVLGDNRADSKDSRVFGAVPTGDVIGRVRARVWPPSRWGSTP